jgi:hypothetical protein
LTLLLLPTLVTGRLSPPTNAFIFITRSSVGRARRAKHKTASRGTRLVVHGLMCKARQGSSKGALLVLQVGRARRSLLVHSGSPQSPFDACRTAALLLTNHCYLPTYQLLYQHRPLIDPLLHYSSPLALAFTLSCSPPLPFVPHLGTHRPSYRPSPSTYAPLPAHLVRVCDPRSQRIFWPSSSSRPIYDPGQTPCPCCVDRQRSKPRRQAQMHL